MVDIAYGTVRSVGELLTLNGAKDQIIDLLYMKDNIVACSMHKGELHWRSRHLFGSHGRCAIKPGRASFFFLPPFFFFSF